MSEEYYIARGMLLGLEYSELCRAYIKSNGKGRDTTWLDRDTLEPIDQQDKFDRLMSSLRRGEWFDGKRPAVD